jgi:hypothetical protein
VDEWWSDDFEVLHWVVERFGVVSAKRWLVSDLANSPAADSTTPKKPRPTEVNGA